MPPLAKTIIILVDDKVPSPLHHHDHDHPVVSRQHHAKPPPFPLATSLSADDTASSRNSISTTSSHSTSASRRSTASLTAFHAVKSSLRAIVLFLENTGVPPASIQELIHLIANKLFLEAMARAEECVEHRWVKVLREEDRDALTILFTAAWAKLVEYSQTQYQKARKEYARYENTQWQEFIGQQGLPEEEQERRRRRRVLQWNPNERQQLVDNLNQSTRAKMDAGKGLALNKEWTRYIRMQQRHLNECKSNCR
jgi:hypothetical protein